MKITNTHNLPAPLFSAIVEDEYHKSGRFSASELAQPPQLRALKLRYAASIVKDAADFLWIIQGKSIHKLLEAHGGPALAEKELVVDLGEGITISGTTDLYTGEVVDWKVTSVWSFLLGGLKPEWEAQVNTYAWLWRRQGSATTSLAIYAILRDWQTSKAKEGGKYPPIPFQRIEVPLWSDERIEGYIRERVALHLAAEATADEQLPACTPEEQWARPASYAVMKRGRKSALRVLASRAEAEDVAGVNPGAYIEERPGRKARCEEYCDASAFCHQFRRERGAVPAEAPVREEVPA